MSGLGEVTRKLVAVFAADVEGYSRLMGADEDGTLKALTERRAILDKLIADHRGRIANTAGDSVLAEFGSAIEAVECAIKAQTTLAEANSSLSTDRRVQFRIGIHIGDVVVRGGDLFGDSVNLAARLEGIAEPGGVCISSSTYDQVRGKVGIEFADLGEQNLKNIDHPVRAYALVRDEPSPTTHAEQARSDALSAPRLSIVVLPFANLSGDPEQNYFVDGVTESLTTDLSRISGSFVIGRHTAFTYKDKAVDLKRVGRELNIRYVLEGAVQRSGNRLRVSAQLVDAESGNQLWGRRFDKPVANLFDMQDEIVAGPKFGRRSRWHRLGQVSSRARRGNRSPCPRGAPPLAPRYRRLPMDHVCRYRQSAGRCLRGGRRVAASEHRCQPQHALHAFQPCRRLGATGTTG
jgi:TolB-like protein/class 3 adenylate cyclase